MSLDLSVPPARLKMYLKLLLSDTSLSGLFYSALDPDLLRLTHKGRHFLDANDNVSFPRGTNRIVLIWLHY